VQAAPLKLGKILGDSPANDDRETCEMWLQHTKVNLLQLAKLIFALSIAWHQQATAFFRSFGLVRMVKGSTELTPRSNFVLLMQCSNTFTIAMVCGLSLRTTPMYSARVESPLQSFLARLPQVT
jgi:hypothetical protein